MNAQIKVILGPVTKKTKKCTVCLINFTKILKRSKNVFVQREFPPSKTGGVCWVELFPLYKFLYQDTWMNLNSSCINSDYCSFFSDDKFLIFNLTSNGCENCTFFETIHTPTLFIFSAKIALFFFYIFKNITQKTILGIKTHEILRKQHFVSAYEFFISKKNKMKVGFG
jgi:hypothetical protein